MVSVAVLMVNAWLLSLTFFPSISYSRLTTLHILIYDVQSRLILNLDNIREYTEKDGRRFVHVLLTNPSSVLQSANEELKARVQELAGDEYMR
jgi:hypothetical protein